MIYISLFWSLTLTHFFETRRKDFWPMFIHHLLALTMVHIIWIMNVHRVGAAMIFLHDVSELPAFALKAYTYYKPGSMGCNFLLVIFNILWFVARIYFYPRHVYVTFTEFPYKGYPAYWIMLACCLCLAVLHMLWSIMLIQLDIRTIKKGGMDRDVRSSSECELCEN